MTHTLALSLCTLIALFFLEGCATEQDIAKDVQTSGGSFLSSVVPSTAPPGARVQLQGSGFGTSPGANGKVVILPGSGMQAIPMGIDSWTDVLIYARVPPVKSTIGFNSVIEVIDSGGKIAYADLPFYVSEAPAQDGSTQGTDTGTTQGGTNGSTKPDPFGSLFHKGSR